MNTTGTHATLKEDRQQQKQEQFPEPLNIVTKLKLQLQWIN